MALSSFPGGWVVITKKVVLLIILFYLALSLFFLFVFQKSGRLFSDVKCPPPHMFMRRGYERREHSFRTGHRVYYSKALFCLVAGCWLLLVKGKVCGSSGSPEEGGGRKKVYYNHLYLSLSLFPNFLLGVPSDWNICLVYPAPLRI